MAKESSLVTIEPNWPAPPGVQALTTTRIGGYSQGMYQSFNLALHVADEPKLVIQNRQRLKVARNLPSEPAWLNQVHGTNVYELTSHSELNTTPDADAVWTQKSGLVCAVLTADCLPLLLTDSKGEKVAAVHAGWRGLASGVIESTLKAMRTGPESTLMAWLGPAIGPEVFEVGQEVYDIFCIKDSSLSSAFEPKGKKWLMDIYSLAKHTLQRLGVTEVYGGEHCTYQETAYFYSYRRTGTTGRMATIIWKD